MGARAIYCIQTHSITINLYKIANILLQIAFIQMEHIDALSRDVMHFFAHADIDDTP